MPIEGVPNFKQDDRTVKELKEALRDLEETGKKFPLYEKSHDFRFSKAILEDKIKNKSAKGKTQSK